MLIRTVRTLSLVLLLAAAVSAAPAQSRGNRVYFGQDIFVASGQQVHNATCVFCSVQVEGDLTGRALVLFGNLNVTGRVGRSALVVVGNAVVDSQARIGGDAIVLGGNAVYEVDDSITGSAYVLGGHLSKTGGHVRSSRRLSVNPIVFASLALLALLLLSSFFFPRTRRRAAITQLS